MPTPPDYPLIVLHGVCKTYDSGANHVTALDGVDLTIAAGSLVALMGPSGCGKTTLLNLLGGMDRPSAGQVSIGGKVLHAMSDRDMTRWRRSQIGVVFQAFNLLPTMTVAENVEFPLLLDGTPAAVRRQRVEAVLRRVNLLPRQKHRPFELSGGEMQRVAVARALVHEPSIILADEPTGNLDSQNGSEVLALLRQVCQDERRTLVMATHSADAAALTDRIVTLRDGRLQSDGPPPAR
jgi:putative ABC transport system ATP-binding protein